MFRVPDVAFLSSVGSAFQIWGPLLDICCEASVVLHFLPVLHFLLIMMIMSDLDDKNLLDIRDCDFQPIGISYMMY